MKVSGINLARKNVVFARCVELWTIAENCLQLAAKWNLQAVSALAVCAWHWCLLSACPYSGLFPQKWNIFPLSTYSGCYWHIVKVVATAYSALQIRVSFEKGCCNCNISWTVDMKAELTLPLIFRPVVLKRTFWTKMYLYAAKLKIMMFKLRYSLMLSKHHLPSWFFWSSVNRKPMKKWLWWVSLDIGWHWFYSPCICALYFQMMCF